MTQESPTDEQVKRLAGHPDCIPPQYVEWFLKGYRAAEINGRLVNSISSNPVLCDSVCTCMAFHKSDECYKLGCKAHRSGEVRIINDKLNKKPNGKE